MNNTVKPKKLKTDTKFEIIRFAAAIGISISLAFIIILFVSDDPMLAIQKLFLGPIESTRRFGNVIELAIPLTFAGLAISVMFKANQFNMGAEGAFFIGAVMAAIVAIKIPLPPFIHPVFAILIAGLVGGIVCAIPAVLKVKWGASELVSSLMLNYVFFNLGIYIINNKLRDVNAGAMASVEFEPSAMLTKLVPKTRIHMGIFIVIVTAIIVYLFLNRTKRGYDLRMTGYNMNFAKYSGIKTTAVILYSQFIGGFIAGIGGATEMLGMYSRFKWQALPGYGFDGIIVAILAKNNPVLVPVAAFFLAYLRIGADRMGSATDLTYEMVSIIQGVIIMLIAAQSFLAKYKQRMVVKEAKIDE